MAAGSTRRQIPDTGSSFLRTHVSPINRSIADGSPCLLEQLQRRFHFGRVQSISARCNNSGSSVQLCLDTRIHIWIHFLEFLRAWNRETPAFHSFQVALSHDNTAGIVKIARVRTIRSVYFPWELGGSSVVCIFSNRRRQSEIIRIFETTNSLISRGIFERYILRRIRVLWSRVNIEIIRILDIL